MSEKDYRFIDHTADFGIQVWASSAKALFLRTAMIVYDLMVFRQGTGRHFTYTCHIEGEDWPDLMINWLREVLGFWHSQEKILCDVTIDALTETGLQATCVLEDYDCHRHVITREIKAVTYHQIFCGPCEKGWCASVIFDL
ncbi:MAG: archease [Desulfobacteraceae bacterium]|nr:archease [Desulfobacteraceae bacterium]